MYTSLVSGETTYLLQDLQSLRTTIADKAQMIDTLSKKIASLPIDTETPKAAALQNSIRKATSIYIKDYLLTLPAPPTVQELERFKKNYLTKSVEDDLTPAPRTSIKKVTVTTGWSPANISNDNIVVEEDDPLLEQMNIVRNYIDQARKAQRFEEVASLQENLEMLKKTYKEQQTKPSTDKWTLFVPTGNISNIYNWIFYWLIIASCKDGCWFEIVDYTNMLYLFLCLYQICIYILYVIYIIFVGKKFCRILVVFSPNFILL